MYVELFEEEKLRQGDVIAGLTIPRLSFKNTGYIYENKSGNFATFADKIVVNAEERLSVVISQCCEFNEGKRNAFAIAPLLFWKKAISHSINLSGISLCELIPISKSPFNRKGREEQILEELRKSNYAEEEERSNVHAFLFEPDGEHLKEPHIVDFTRITSISMKDHDFVHSKKVLQLQDEMRLALQLKIGYFFARKAE